MPDQRQKARNKKHDKRGQSSKSPQGGQDRQTGGLPQDPNQKGDRERHA
ncbi:MAG TPA: hypothetical protein VGL38_00940 [bacterium]